MVGMVGMSGCGGRIPFQGRKAPAPGMVAQVDGVPACGWRESQRGGIDVTGLRDAVVALEVEQRALHAQPVDPMELQSRSPGCPVPFGVHHPLEVADPRAGFFEAKAASTTA